MIDNRAGAGGVIAGELTAKAPADGYTLMLGTVAALAANVSLKKSLPYDPLRDFAPITLAATQNLILIVTPALPVKNVKDLIALAKTKPGHITFASAGSGAGGHLSDELFKLLAGIDLLHIPYKGMAPALVDVISDLRLPRCLSVSKTRRRHVERREPVASRALSDRRVVQLTLVDTPHRCGKCRHA